MDVDGITDNGVIPEVEDEEDAEAELMDEDEAEVGEFQVIALLFLQNMSNCVHAARRPCLNCTLLQMRMVSLWSSAHTAANTLLLIRGSFRLVGRPSKGQETRSKP